MTQTETAVEISISSKDAAELFGKTVNNVIISRYDDSKTVFGKTIGLTRKDVQNVTRGRAHRHSASTLEAVVSEVGKHLHQVEVAHLSGLIKIIKQSA